MRRRMLVRGMDYTDAQASWEALLMPRPTMSHLHGNERRSSAAMVRRKLLYAHTCLTCLWHQSVKHSCASLLRL